MAFVRISIDCHTVNESVNLYTLSIKLTGFYHKIMSEVLYLKS